MDEKFTSLDNCINENFQYESMRSRLNTTLNKNKSTESPDKAIDLVPITFGTITKKSDDSPKKSFAKKIRESQNRFL